ncbi:hypothetical protein [Gimesia sp.]|uniref:hypothetical protein n=1 Tax=Gimesia sp. TaxID=2024833 RepID=UPI0025C6210C|nr:hypothetical protein [Gimesia sp.]
MNIPPVHLYGGDRKLVAEPAFYPTGNQVDSRIREPVVDTQSQMVSCAWDYGNKVW